jgi:hypothetical protein
VIATLRIAQLTVSSDMGNCAATLSCGRGSIWLSRYPNAPCGACDLSCNAIPFFACSMLIFWALVSLEKTIDRPWRDAQGHRQHRAARGHREDPSAPRAYGAAAADAAEVPPGARAPPVQSTLR